MLVPPERLDVRFDRMRVIVAAWEIRYNQLPERVVALFDLQDLDSIRELLEEKRQLARLIPDTKEFIERWEPVSQPIATRNEE
ncbi:hypothetical protein CIG75_09175 [Tumebacillus algifaecis]|uniref:Uncharacterized protein n=1 Tax=Tumebacillus algifaecis TaxID=1214604 RepID=A0A223D189_9BACL|nr:hypothetical protein [Tumebacillus algifaecis]ASS75134.1 hypothetical protein CIG75_09175 [Tumebacillus algifaecis]